MSAETIFVSYSSKDRPFALGLVKELQNLGANVWIDQLGIGLGENWDNAIEEALEKSETFMLILSQTSVESPNVQDEVSIAINTNKKMVPILIEECKLPMRWQRRQYADLANNPDKAIHDILTFLGLQEKASASLKKVLSLITRFKQGRCGKVLIHSQPPQQSPPTSQKFFLERTVDKFLVL